MIFLRKINQLQWAQTLLQNKIKKNMIVALSEVRHAYSLYDKCIYIFLALIKFATGLLLICFMRYIKTSQVPNLQY